MLALRGYAAWGTKAFPKHYGKEKSIIKSSTWAFNETTVVQQMPLKFMFIGGRNDHFQPGSAMG